MFKSESRTSEALLRWLPLGIGQARANLSPPSRYFMPQLLTPVQRSEHPVGQSDHILPQCQLPSLFGGLVVFWSGFPFSIYKNQGSNPNPKHKSQAPRKDYPILYQRNLKRQYAFWLYLILQQTRGANKCPHSFCSQALKK